MMLIAQHWAIIVIGVAAMAVNYASAPLEEQSCIEKFGDDYKDYMQRVPRMNFLAGLVHLARGAKRA